MTLENISLSNLQERMLRTQRGSTLQPPDHQSDAHPTDPPRPAGQDYHFDTYLKEILAFVYYGSNVKNQTQKKKT